MTLNYFFPTRWAPTSYKRIITPLTGVIFHTSYPFIFVHWYGLYTNITPFRTIVMRLTLNSLAHFFCSSNAGLSLVLFQYGHLACGGSEGWRDGVERWDPRKFNSEFAPEKWWESKTIPSPSFWYMVYFQGRSVKLREDWKRIVAWLFENTSSALMTR